MQLALKVNEGISKTRVTILKFILHMRKFTVNTSFEYLAQDHIKMAGSEFES